MPSPTPPSAAEFTRGMTIYQIYPRSFLDTDGDGVGDLAGIVSRLEHVAALGVDAVWLSPVFTSPMADFGYDVADYRGIDPLFGDLAAFDALVAETHRLGLKLIIDQVYCHTSERHPWFLESKDRSSAKADWYVWGDAKPDGSPPNNWQSVFYGPAWSWDARRQQYYMHNFLPEQPQLNVHHPQVQDALLDVARFWFERGVDGFRLDALNFLMPSPELSDNPPDPEAPPGAKPFNRQLHLHNQSHPAIPAFLERLRALADHFGGRFLVAEVPGERALEEMRLYMAPGRVHSAYSFDFLYADQLTAARVRASLGDWREGWPAWAFSNHDAPRAVSRWAQGREEGAYARLLLLLLASLRGHVFVYQGEELGLPQAEVPYERLVDPEAKKNWPATLGRDGARTPMPWTSEPPYAGFSRVEPWLPVDPRHLPLSVEVQVDHAGSTLDFARRVFQARRRSRALQEGALTFGREQGELLAFERECAGERLLCVFNLGFSPAAVPQTRGDWRVIVSTNARLEGARPPDELPVCQGFIAKAV